MMETEGEARKAREMFELCLNIRLQTRQKEMAEINEIRAKQAVRNLNTLISGAHEQIAELEKFGTERPSEEELKTAEAKDKARLPAM